MAKNVQQSAVLQETENEIDTVAQSKENDKLVVGRYTFTNERVAQEARDEANAIRYLMKKTDTSDPKQIYLLYNSMLDKELFKTAIGLDYLKELQQYLYQNKTIPNDRIRPIPVNRELEEVYNERRENTRVKGELLQMEKEKNKMREWFVRSLILNIVLIIVVAAMVMILKSSSNPNIMDYEAKLQNKYATWQEQIESQEESVRAREKKLNPY